MLDGAVQTEIRVPPWPVRDECLLQWYFSRGQTSFERSTFGAALDRAQMFGDESIPRHWGREPVFDSRTGMHVIGWERALSARPTSEVREPAGYTPDLKTLEDYADVSSRLKRIDRVSPISAQVIELIYGDQGAFWASEDTTVGRMGAVYHKTAKGRALVAADAAKSPIVLTPHKRMFNIVRAYKAQPNADRSLILAVCARQADVLERTARMHWFVACAEAPAKTKQRVR